MGGEVRGPVGLIERRRWPAVLALLVLAPISAEHLIGYDDTIGRPDELIAALVIFGPLYGGPALLTREVARRTGRGWPTMLLLGLAFGLVQAGLLDMSLFSPGYRDIPYWAALVEPTWLPGLGFSASMLLNFVVNHMIRSYCAPIAVVEALFADRDGSGRADQPWLGRVGLIVVSGLYLASATFIVVYTLDTEAYVPSVGQLVGTAVVAAALVVIALRLPPARPRAAGPAPQAWLVGCLAVAGLAAHLMVPANWIGFAVQVAVLAGLGWSVLRWSRRTGWTPRHVLALGGASLLVHAALAFVVRPLGDPTAAAKFTTNTVLAVLVLVVLVWAHARLRPPESGAVWLAVVLPAGLAALIVSTAAAGPCPDLMVMGPTVCGG